MEERIMKKILFATSEAVPFIKTGGLADVAGSLPKYFDKENYEVRVMLPKYMCIKEEWRSKLEYVTHFYMDWNWRSEYVGVLKLEHEGVTFYFIDNEGYFNGFALNYMDWIPDIIHCHDWQTGLVPVYLDNFRYGNEYFRGIKTIMTIHNLKFQGTWDTKRIKNMTGLPEYYFVPDKLEAYKDANYLKGGIVYADWVTTVSNTYAVWIIPIGIRRQMQGLTIILPLRISEKRRLRTRLHCRESWDLQRIPRR